MNPLSEWPLPARQHIIGVFTDIDDTLTTHGQITPDALRALTDLKAAGLTVIAITGRHVGWCDAWLTPDGLALPLDAIVAENGALAWIRSDALELTGQNAAAPCNHEGRKLSKIYQNDAAQRQRNQQRLHAVASQLLADIPGLTRSKDIGGRETDLAFDYAEHAQLDAATVQRVVAKLQAAGLHTSVSSIHIHGCCDDVNKWQGACWIVQRLYGRDLCEQLDQWVFVGDSGNDQPMFEHFAHSVGVANIQRCAASLSHLPRYVTPGERGAGFAEVAHAILEARRA